jgi:phosphate transport system substrate-binding protein
VKSRLVLALLGFAGVHAVAAEVTCASADSMAGLMDAWTRGFTALHADTPARVTLRAKFSADAFDALLRGEVQVASFSRELFPDEHARYIAKFGGEPLLVPIATGSRDTKGGTHAIAIFVHEKNPLARLTLAQLREIFARDGRITKWGQLGLTGEWVQKEISLHSMTVRRETGNPPGVVNYLAHTLLDGRPWRSDLHEHVDVSGGPQALELIVRAVAEDQFSVGYSGFAYAQPGTKTLALAADERGPFFAGSADEVARRSYPLVRTIYLCLSGAPDSPTRAFVRYMLASEGQAAIAHDAEKFFPLPATAIASANRLLATAGVDPALPTYEPQPVASPKSAGYLTPAGAIAVVGYNDMQEMLMALCARFTAVHSNCAFALDLKGTRTAPPALAAGRSLFAPMGAEFSEREFADYRAVTGGEPLVFRIAHASIDPHALSGPLAIFVRRDNPISSLTLAEVAGIFTGAKPLQDLRPCGLFPETALGHFMRERALGGAAFAPGFSGFPQSADVVQWVAENSRAIGFAAAMRATAAVKILALAPEAGVPPIFLTEENLVAGRYPLDRHLLIYARLPLDPITREFLRFALSRDGQQIVAGGALGYLPLSFRDAAVERAKLGSL